MTGIDVGKHMLDDVFERQIDPEKAISFPLGALVMLGTYNVHQAVPAQDAGWRTFLRLVYSVRQFDRLGNTVNTLFNSEYTDHGWEFQLRPKPALEALPTNTKAT